MDSTSLATEVKSLVDWLDRFPDGVIPLDQLTDRLEHSGIGVDSVRDFIKFSDERYERNLVAHGSAFYALVLCWKTGQSSPIHDHRGASCAVRVLQGTATEVRYDRSEAGKLTQRSTAELNEGCVCGSYDSDIHQITNLETTPLITLHIYSPFLTNIHVYDPDSDRVEIMRDPLVEKIEKGRLE